MKEGDYLVFYTIMEKKDGEVIQPQLRGVYKASSNSFKENTRLFKPVGEGDELFPHRVKLEPVYVPEKSASFKALIPKLEFITNKKRWNTHLFGRAMRLISRTDFETILSALKRNDN